MLMRKNKAKIFSAFTLVEIMAVAAVIALLAGVTLVSYGFVQQEAREAQIKSDLLNASMAMKNYSNFNSGYPSSVPSNFTPSEGVTLTLAAQSNINQFCVNGSNGSIIWHISNKDQEPVSGVCPTSW